MSQPPLEYRSREAAPAKAIISWRMLWLCARVGFFLTVIMGVVLPHVQRTYEELQFRLPAPTVWLLRVRAATWSNLFGYGWVFIWIVLLAIPFVWPMIIPPQRPEPGKKRRKSLAWMLVSLLFMLLAGLITVAAVMPMFSLVEAYQSAEHK